MKIMILLLAILAISCLENEKHHAANKHIFGGPIITPRNGFAYPRERPVGILRRGNPYAHYYRQRISRPIYGPTPTPLAVGSSVVLPNPLSTKIVSRFYYPYMINKPAFSSRIVPNSFSCKEICNAYRENSAPHSNPFKSLECVSNDQDEDVIALPDNYCYISGDYCVRDDRKCRSYKKKINLGELMSFFK